MSCMRSNKERGVENRALPIHTSYVDFIVPVAYTPKRARCPNLLLPPHTQNAEKLPANLSYYIFGSLSFSFSFCSNRAVAAATATIVGALAQSVFNDDNSLIALPLSASGAKDMIFALYSLLHNIWPHRKKRQPFHHYSFHLVSSAVGIQQSKRTMAVWEICWAFVSSILDKINPFCFILQIAPVSIGWYTISSALFKKEFYGLRCYWLSWLCKCIVIQKLR